MSAQRLCPLSSHRWHWGLFSMPHFPVPLTLLSLAVGKYTLLEQPPPPARQK